MSANAFHEADDAPGIDVNSIISHIFLHAMASLRDDDFPPQRPVWPQLGQIAASDEAHINVFVEYDVARFSFISA